MLPISQSANSHHSIARSSGYRGWMGCAAGLLTVLLAQNCLGQTEIENTVVIVSRTNTAHKTISKQTTNMGENRSADIGLSPKLPKVPSVASMTGKMGKAEELLRSSNSKLSSTSNEAALTSESVAPRDWNGQSTTWAAPNFYSHPLYFEQVNLERYQTKLPPCAIPLVSYAHFLGSVPLLPYQAGYRHPGERSYTLGHWRPGDPVPNQVHWTPLTKRGLLYQGAATSGAVFLLP